MGTAGYKGLVVGTAGSLGAKRSGNAEASSALSDDSTAWVAPPLVVDVASDAPGPGCVVKLVAAENPWDVYK